MKRIEWYHETSWLNRALTGGGAFLITLDPEGVPNPMTIGWAQVGIVWSMPVMSVWVRLSRYSYECVRSSNTFAVSVPRPGTHRDALALCGSTSGRDRDKITDAGLETIAGQSIETPILAECALHYECEIISRTQQVLDDFAPGAESVLKTFYPEGDHHLIVLGRIVESYITEEPS